MTSEEFKEIMKKRSNRNFEEGSADLTAVKQVAKFFYMLGQRNPHVPFREREEAREYMWVYQYFLPLDIVRDIPKYWKKHYRRDDTDIANIRKTLAKRLETDNHNLL